MNGYLKAFLDDYNKFLFCAFQNIFIFTQLNPKKFSHFCLESGKYPKNQFFIITGKS